MEPTQEEVKITINVLKKFIKIEEDFKKKLEESDYDQKIQDEHNEFRWSTTIYGDCEEACRHR